MAYDLGSLNQKRLSESSKARLTGLMLLCMAIASTVVLRSAFIQLFKNPRLEKMARRQYQAHSLIRPRRGFILDRNGEPLAVNVESNSLAANPSKTINKRQLAKFLSRAVDVPYARILQRLSENREFVWIKRHLNKSELRNLKRWHVMDADGDLVDGLWLVKENVRVYPHKHLAAHTMGAVNIDSEGIEGIELWFNERLRGKVVSVKAIKDALGRPTFIDALAAKNLQDGEPVSLTLDASLQFEVEQQLKSSLQKTGSKSGTVIVMNASNGEILALANEPSFNANEKGTPNERRRNRGLTDGFEPGSTFKAVLAASALSNGFKLTDKVWAEQGSFVLQGHKISEAEAKEKFGWIDLKKMLKVSSNVAAAKIALKLGADRYMKSIRSFGFGTKTGVGFPGEISGRIPVRKEWSPLSLANIGFGQGILVTPIQMTRAYAAILNGGILVQPSLIRNLREPLKDPSLIATDPPTPNRIFSEKVSQDLIQALQEVTADGGTGGKAALPGYRVAGKTGTAQMVDPASGKYSREKYVSSFIGFAVGVEPKIVIFASLSEPRGAYYASVTAAPLFKEVLGVVAHQYSLPFQAVPNPIRLASATQQDRLKLSQAAADFSYKPSLPAGTLAQSQTGWFMPQLKGLSPREVFGVLQGHRFRVEMKGMGTVSSQLPESGNSIAEGGLIRLKLSEP